MTERIAIALPWPPSTNHYWRSLVLTRRGKGGRGESKPRAAVLISSDGLAYRAQVERWVRQQNIAVGLLTGKLAVSITAFPPDRRARDLDNLLKSLLDAIKESKVIRDDADIDDLRITRGPIRPRGAVHVYISEIPGEATESRELFDEFAIEESA